MYICKKEECVGCTACVSVCSKDAIGIRYSEKGFAYPIVNIEKCVECGVCQQTCPANHQDKNTMSSHVLACWNKKSNVRWKASSGGIFYPLAEQIIKRGGVVYGAAFNENMEVRHQRADTESGLSVFSGSKYVQSNCMGTYQLVKNDLRDGRTVLFSGTPCQVSGLKNYLKVPYENLICVDLICHGVPSPMVFKDYVQYQIQKNGSHIKSMNFRYKKPCWSVSSMKIVFENGKEYVASKFRDPYLYFFSSSGGDLTLRESCFKCRYTSPERVGDITLGDFWNIKAERFVQRGIEKGVNLVLLNTERGKSLFNLIKPQLYIEERTWDDAYKSNKSLSSAWDKPDIYDAFWVDYIKNGLEYTIDKYCKLNDIEAEEELNTKLAKKRAHQYFIPLWARNFVRVGKRFVRRLIYEENK